MNYLKLYTELIVKAKSSTRSKCSAYYELHHIIPRCIGGLDIPDNLVLLTAKEHFVAHHLLARIHPNSHPLHSAFFMMCNCTSGNQDRYKVTATSYGEARKAISNIMSLRWKENNPNNHRSVKGESNPMFGSHRVGNLNPFYGKRHSEETKLRIAKPKLGIKQSDEHRAKLRASWDSRPIIKCPYCDQESIHASNMRRYHFDNCKFKSSIL